MRSFADLTADPQLLLDGIVRRTAEVLRAFCGIALVSEDRQWLNPVALFDEDPEKLGILGRLAATAPLRLDAPHPLARSIQTGEPALLAQVSPEQLRSLYARLGDQQSAIGLEIRSVLFIPLRARGESLGGLSLIRHGPNATPFEDDDVRLAQILADHAALAITNARFFSDAQIRLAERLRLEERLRLLTKLSREFSIASSDCQKLIDLVARRMSEIFGGLCVIRLVSDDVERLATLGGVHHENAQLTNALRDAMRASPKLLNGGVAERVILTGQPVLIPSLAAGQPAGTLEAEFLAFVGRMGITSMVAAPLSSHGRVMGVVSLNRIGSGAPYHEDDLRLLEELAVHAALALSNGRLLEASKQELADRMRTEEVLRRGFLEAAPDAVLIIDAEGRITLVNSQTETLFGFERAEMVGQPIELLIPKRLREQHTRERSGYLERPTTRPMDAGLNLVALRKDGSEFAAEISLSPIETPDGTLVAAAIRDVTERRREMEERNRKMQEANRIKSEFLANMSHELRTPLNAIIGFAALMHGGKAGPLSEVHKEYLGDILNSSRHLLQLINDILDLAKVESGRMEIHAEHVELLTVVNEVKDILRGLAAEKRVRLSVELDHALPSVRVDPRMLKQILYNFLSNAIKFTPDGGQVWLRIQPEQDATFRIDVEDTGIGINAEDMSRLFVEFQQLDAGAARRYPGTGLGLALTKRIVEAQGGRLAVKSLPGEGSTFSAILPREGTTSDRSSTTSVEGPADKKRAG